MCHTPAYETAKVSPDVTPQTTPETSLQVLDMFPLSEAQCDCIKVMLVFIKAKAEKVQMPLALNAFEALEDMLDSSASIPDPTRIIQGLKCWELYMAKHPKDLDLCFLPGHKKCVLDVIAWYRRRFREKIEVKDNCTCGCF